jgi:outer membrane protein
MARSQSVFSQFRTRSIGVAGLFFIGFALTISCAQPENSLGVEDCVRLTLEKNFVIRYNRLEQEKSKESLRDRQGAYDPALGVSYNHSRDETLDYADGTISETEETTQGAVSVTGRMAFGTQYEFSVSSKDIRTGLTASDSRENTPLASIQVLQPLLKGGIVNEARTAVHVSKKELAVEYWRFRSVVTDTIVDVMEAYADLYLASRRLEIAINNRDLAAQLLKENQKRVTLGSQAESDIILAESRSSQRQEVVFQAELNLHYQENRLKQLISDEMLGLLESDLKVGELPSLSDRHPVVSDDFPVALEENPLFQMAQLGTGIQELLLLQKKYNLLPTLDLVLRYDTFGAGSDTSTAWDSFKDRDGENWYGGLQFSVPITNRSNKAQRAIAGIQLRQSEIELDRIQQAVLLQLDNAAFCLKSNWERMQASRHNRELAERSLEAEGKKMNAARSTSFFVLDQQQRVADARLQEIRSKVDYFKSLLAYQKASGTLLAQYSVTLPGAEPRNENYPPSF